MLNLKFFKKMDGINDNNVMWLDANFKVSFYQPEKLEAGMWFMNSLYPGTDKEFVELWLLEDGIEEDYDDFVDKNGFPVEPIITLEMNNPDELDLILAYSQEIGWIHQEDDSLKTFDIDDANWIIQNNGGKVWILIDEDLYENNKDIQTISEDEGVILKYLFEEENNEYLID